MQPQVVVAKKMLQNSVVSMKIAKKRVFIEYIFRIRVLTYTSLLVI